MSQLILNLDNKELENNLKDFAKKHMHIIKKEFDDEICDKRSLDYITDSASYIHNLRREGNL